MTVVVVTDSSARIPPELAAAYGIRVVPLHILVDGEDLRDGLDAVPSDIHDRPASTSGPSPAELEAVYRQALDDSGGDGVLAAHLSAKLSGTCGTAQRVAEQLGAQVTVVDSGSVAMGLGFVALAAARAAADGADLPAVAAAAQRTADGADGFIVVQQLDNLRRSGRIGGAAAWLGTALSLKPLLRVEDGNLVLAQRIRTASRAIAVMVDRVCESAGERPVSLAVHHVANPDGARELADNLAQRLPAAEAPVVSELGPVLGLHVGAGALGVVVAAPR
ncbi:DegV family protein [Mycolicibacterium brumae]|uniref:DegV family protein n=1 Tax=Mycolicibacterium brumae TaxID=85968 RepID=A0A2G5P5U3_9MYCO|nr:DegV family protein [Mycolicibacterium brumae]MCV7191534.1 DegV family protein [Mycolicibacterium brumae]PIB73636.1 DegV family protein [Mycolicibacterium brumae]RWA16249.1 hypothetical protein MBRU_09065 [Mycolicibacterium brumae DSM 44177]UWW09358.1 DegV family protein [Mycolicibacterium brumae]